MLFVLGRLTGYRQNSYNSQVISFGFSVIFNPFLVVANNEFLKNFLFTKTDNRKLFWYIKVSLFKLDMSLSLQT